MEKLRTRPIVHRHNPELPSLLCVAGPLPHTSNHLTALRGGPLPRKGPTAKVGCSGSLGPQEEAGREGKNECCPVAPHPQGR